MDRPIWLLICDDHPTLRFGLSVFFKQSPEFFLAGEASTGEEAVEKACEFRPDVILMDLAMPKKSGLEAIREILAIHPEIRIIAFTAFSNGEQILAAIKAGAIGYLVKDCSPQQLLTAVRNAYQGKPVLNQQIELNLLQQIHQQQASDFSAEKLTDREVEILRWLALGLTNTQIAAKGCISEGTVRSHVSNLLGKLSLENRAQAVVYALRKGLINIPL